MFVDLGGAYIGHQQTKILAIMKDLGLYTYKLDTSVAAVLNIKVYLY